MVLMPGFQSTRLATEGALEPFLFLYTDDSIQGNPETCNQSSMMLNYEVKNNIKCFVDEVVESKEEWLKQRFIEIEESKEKTGEKMTIADVKCNMSLKPNTYQKYDIFIAGLIEQLNELYFLPK